MDLYYLNQGPRNTVLCVVLVLARCKESSSACGIIFYMVPLWPPRESEISAFSFRTCSNSENTPYGDAPCSLAKSQLTMPRSKISSSQCGKSTKATPLCFLQNAKLGVTHISLKCITTSSGITSVKALNGVYGLPGNSAVKNLPAMQKIWV